MGGGEEYQNNKLSEINDKLLSGEYDPYKKSGKINNTLIGVSSLVAIGTAVSALVIGSPLLWVVTGIVAVSTLVIGALLNKKKQTGKDKIIYDSSDVLEIEGRSSNKRQKANELLQSISDRDSTIGSGGHVK